MARFSQGLFRGLSSPSFASSLGVLGQQIGSAQAVGRQQERRQGLLEQLMQDDPLQQAQAVQALGVETKDPRLILQGTQLLQDESSRSASNELNKYLEVVRNPLSTADEVDAAANSAAKLATTNRYLDINDVRNQLTQARNFQSDRMSRIATSYVNSPSYSEQNDSAFEEQYGSLGKTALTAAKVSKASGEQALSNDADARLLKQNEPLILDIDRKMQQLAVSDSYNKEEMERLQAQYNELISETPGYRERFSSLSSVGLGYRDDVLRRRDQAVERVAEQEALFVSNTSDNLFLAFRDTDDPQQLLLDKKEKDLSVEGLSDRQRILIAKAFDQAEEQINDYVETVINRSKEPKGKLTPEEADFFSSNSSAFGSKYAALESGLNSPNVYVRSGAVKSIRLVYDQNKKASQSDQALQFKAEQQALSAIDLYLRDRESQAFAFGDDIYDVIEDFKTGSDSQQKTFSRFEDVLTQKFRENPQASIRETVEQAVVEIPAMQAAISTQAQVDTSKRQQRIQDVRTLDEPIIKELMQVIVSERYPNATEKQRLEYLTDPAIRYEAEINLEADYQDKKRQKRLQAVAEAGSVPSI